jgi:hypothetical protein
VTVREFGWSALFGLVSFSYLLEDRRPDLTEAEAAASPGYKYKTTIAVRMFRTRVGTVTHSVRPGFLFVNGEEK